MTLTGDRSLLRLATVVSPALVLADAAYVVIVGGSVAELLNLLVVAGSFVAAGLVTWDRRPSNRTGRLLVAAGLCQLTAVFAWPPIMVLAPLAIVAGAVEIAILGYLILAFPTGELQPPAKAWMLGLASVLFLVVRAADIAVVDPATRGWPGPNPYRVVDDPGVTAWVEAIRLATIIAVIGVLFALIVVRWSRASGPARRALTPVLVVGTVVVLVYVAVALTSLTDLEPGVRQTLLWLQDLSLALFPVGFLVGFVRIYMTRSAIADLVVELGATPTPARLRDALSEALGDPSLSVAWWSPDRGAYVGVGGDPYALPDEDSGRAVTRLARDGVPIAAIVHDPALLDDPGLVASVASAMRLAVENERLQAEVEAQLEEVRASRMRIVEAGDAERNRLERDLHDGAQQRLVALAMALRVARGRLGDDPDPALRDSLAQASDEVRAALAELRELARGIHPAILTEAGLGAAIESLADRSIVPATVEGATDERFAPMVERTAYFLVSEALTNVNKHARATRACIRIGRLDSHLAVEIRDDGVGGADVRSGSGLRGLADRLSAVDGTLEIESPPGGGTRLVATIPLGASPENPG